MAYASKACPKCGSKVYDNRDPKDKRSPKSPDFKCSNKECDFAKWISKKGESAKQGDAKSSDVQIVKRPLGPLYRECLVFAAAAVREIVGKDAPAEVIVQATATLFIGANQSNAPINATPKPAATVKREAPPPSDDDYPFSDDDASDGLPF